MGILDFTVSKKKVEGRPAPNFPNGFVFTEVALGVEDLDNAIALVGTMMPKNNLGFGSSQRISKEFYAGSSEPVIQIMGYQEEDITLTGEFNLKTIKDTSLFDGKESAAVQIQESIENMMKRGNLIKFTLGEWKRYGFISSVNFKLYDLTRIEYEIKLMIASKNIPKNYYLVQADSNDIYSPNTKLAKEMQKQMDAMNAIPKEVPLTVTDVLRNSISNIANSINLVTSFVEGSLDDIEKMQNSAHRAIGLIKNARAFVARNQRAIGRIARNSGTLGSKFTDEVEAATATIKNIEFINRVEATNKDMSALLGDIQRKYQKLISSLPLKRHFVKEGDSLQSLSIQYYGSVDNWEKIKSHNKLLSNELVKGSVIVIPKV